MGSVPEIKIDYWIGLDGDVHVYHAQSIHQSNLLAVSCIGRFSTEIAGVHGNIWTLRPCRYWMGYMSAVVNDRLWSEFDLLTSTPATDKALKTTRDINIALISHERLIVIHDNQMSERW